MRALFRQTCGPGQEDRWLWWWRAFFMACAEHALATRSGGVRPSRFILYCKVTDIEGTAATLNMVNLADGTQACRMAAEVPARMLGLSGKGHLALGCDADLVLLDDDLRGRATYVAGRAAFESGLS